MTPNAKNKAGRLIGGQGFLGVFLFIYPLINALSVMNGRILFELMRKRIEEPLHK